jgi:hypothetical protein
MSKEQIEIKVVTYKEERLNYFTALYEKAKNKFDRLFKKHKDAPYLSDEFQKMSDAGHEAEFLGDVVKMLKQSEWISVEERLPENGVHCILCCDMKRIDGTHSQYVCDGYFAERWKIIAHYVDDDCATEYNEIEDEYYLKEGWYEVIKNWDDYNSIVIDDTVTHWMPLPEAPKMKGGGAE